MKYKTGDRVYSKIHKDYGIVEERLGDEYRQPILILLDCLKNNTGNIFSHKVDEVCLPNEIIVYLSGPITGHEETYLQDFQKAEKTVNKLHPGCRIINPVTTCQNEGLTIENTWEEFMAVCLRVMHDASHIFMLPGWQSSRGACVEYYIGLERGIIVL